MKHTDINTQMKIIPKKFIEAINLWPVFKD